MVRFVSNTFEENAERTPERMQELKTKEQGSHGGRLTILDLCLVHIAGVSMEMVLLILLSAEPCPFTRLGGTMPLQTG